MILFIYFRSMPQDYMLMWPKKEKDNTVFISFVTSLYTKYQEYHDTVLSLYHPALKQRNFVEFMPKKQREFDLKTSKLLEIFNIRISYMGVELNMGVGSQVRRFSSSVFTAIVLLSLKIQQDQGHVWRGKKLPAQLLQVTTSASMISFIPDRS